MLRSRTDEIEMTVACEDSNPGTRHSVLEAKIAVDCPKQLKQRGCQWRASHAARNTVQVEGEGETIPVSRPTGVRRTQQREVSVGRRAPELQQWMGRTKRGMKLAPWLLADCILKESNGKNVRPPLDILVRRP
ncbi:hypothetical protein NDU88_006039 [Pleurodeles waltl]|uniref:Uncharacterized protein n=1 Tax=Pleurodeles waltl TaxID=8319 RepID=A0AAV7SNH8_PLEWA|nr:hypothetical protein NDU88_006039 [Pleurodeles waltl]